MPRSQGVQSPPSYRVSAQINPFGGVSGSITPYKTPYQSLGDGLSGFADALDNIVRREMFLNDCMIASGWKQISANEVSLTLETFARVGLNPQVDYTGSATGYLDGSGTIKLQSALKSECVGTFRYDSTKTGGTGIIRCDDGDSAQIVFSKITGSSGFGSGTTKMGKPLRFVYGLTPEMRERFLKE